MYVGLKMLTDFVTITPETLVSDADKMMEDNKLWLLLVKDGDKLAGFVTKEGVRKALPSDATTLERHELNYLLSKLTVGKIMRDDLETVSPETDIEVAADIMYGKNLHGLAVVDAKNNLLGYINRNVLLDVLVEEMGLRQGGSRIVFEVEDRTGVIHEVSGIIQEMGISIISTGTFFHNGTRIVVFRVQSDDPGPIESKLEEIGYKLVGPETFKEKWK